MDAKRKNGVRILYNKKLLLQEKLFRNPSPTNDCSFKERAKSDIQIKNSCTISYFLFSLWLTCQIDKGFLKEIELVGGIYGIISKIIKLIDRRSWAKAKHCWLVECLKKSPSIQEEKRVTFDCFGKLNDFFINFMVSFQKYKLKKVSREKIEGTIVQYSSDKFFTNFIVQLNREIVCKDKCGKCFKETALFENVPFWVVHELKEEKRTLCSIVKQFINLNLTLRQNIIFCAFMTLMLIQMTKSF